MWCKNGSKGVDFHKRLMPRAGASKGQVRCAEKRTEKSAEGLKRVRLKRANVRGGL